MANFQTDTFTEAEIAELITENTSGYTKQDALNLFDKSGEVNSKIDTLDSDLQNQINSNNSDINNLQNQINSLQPEKEALAYDFIGGL